VSLRSLQLGMFEWDDQGGLRKTSSFEREIDLILNEVHLVNRFDVYLNIVSVYLIRHEDKIALDDVFSFTSARYESFELTMGRDFS
jgi:hypothetical protein